MEWQLLNLLTCQTGNLEPVYIKFNNDGAGKKNVNGTGNNKKIFYTKFEFVVIMDQISHQSE